MTQPDTDPVLCPACGADTVNICEHSSAMAVVWYLRCTSCFWIWTVPKSPDGERPQVRASINATELGGYRQAPSRHQQR